MSNEENSIIRFGDDTLTALNFTPATDYVLAPHGSPIWQGSPDELAALVRDARRYRKLKQGAMLTYMAAWKCTSAEITTAEGYHSELDSFADALPEVEQK